MRSMACMVLVMAVLAPQQARGEVFSAQSFQVFGGIDDGSGRLLLEQRAPRRLPEDLRSRVVSFASPLSPGSVLVRTGARKLFFILPGGKAIEYNVGVGREGFAWSGTNRVSRKAEWPDWRPPPEMIARERRKGRELPAFMPGGPGNPLGARAIYIGDTAFRIHGTTEPWSIGQAVSSGCIRMIDEEVIDLYERVAIGAMVVVEP